MNVSNASSSSRNTLVKVNLVLSLLYLCRDPDISASYPSMWKYRDCPQCQAFPEAAEGVNGCSQFHAFSLDQGSIQSIPRNLSTHLHLSGIVFM